MALTPFERIRLDKAVDEGFGIRRDGEDDWLAYESLGAPAAIRLTVVPGGYVAAVDHDGIAADLRARWKPWDGKAPTGSTAFVVLDTAPLHELVREMWWLARALPLAPLRELEKRIRGLPRSTEAERLVVQRVAGYVPQRADGLLGRPLPGDRLRPAAAAAREPHQAFDAVRGRRRAARCLQWPAARRLSRFRVRCRPDRFR